MEGVPSEGYHIQYFHLWWPRARFANQSRQLPILHRALRLVAANRCPDFMANGYINVDRTLEHNAMKHQVMNYRGQWSSTHLDIRYCLPIIVHVVLGVVTFCRHVNLTTIFASPLFFYFWNNREDTSVLRVIQHPSWRAWRRSPALFVLVAFTDRDEHYCQSTVSRLRITYPSEIHSPCSSTVNDGSWQEGFFPAIQKLQHITVRVVWRRYFLPRPDGRSRKFVWRYDEDARNFDSVPAQTLSGPFLRLHRRDG